MACFIAVKCFITRRVGRGTAVYIHRLYAYPVNSRKLRVTRNDAARRSDDDFASTAVSILVGIAAFQLGARADSLYSSFIFKLRARLIRRERREWKRTVAG